MRILIYFIPILLAAELLPFLDHRICTSLFQDWINFVEGKIGFFFYICVVYIRLYM